MIDDDFLKTAVKAEIDRRRKAMFYLQNPFLFQKEILCKPEWKNNLAEIHEQGLEWINQGKKKKLILWPRKHLKSTVFTQGESLRRALLDPDIRILISSAKWDNAKRFLGAIKGYLVNPKFIELYGELLPGTKDKYLKNNDGELTLRSRKNLGLKEPTFSTTGLDAAQTSQHYDLIIHDDLVERKNIGSTEMIDKVITYYKDSLDLLDPQKELWILGTRWHPLDLYGWIMKEFCDERCLKNNYEHVDKCKCDFDVTLKEIEVNGKYIFPSMFNDEEMDVLLRQKGSYEFASQYRNNPVDPSVCWFRQAEVESSLVSVEEIQSKADKLIWYIAVDPAESMEKRSCLTAAVAVGVDQETGIWYVDDARGVKVETPGFIDLCFDVYSKYPYPQFGMETNTRKSLSYAVKDQMSRRGIYFEIKDLSPIRGWAGGNIKDQRIKRLIPLFQYGRIKIRRDLTRLIQDLITIPATESFDIIDALSYIMDMVPAGIGANKNIKLPKRTVGWSRTGL